MSAPTAEDRDDGVSTIVSPAYLAVTIANLTVVALAAFDGLAVVAALPSIAEDLGDVALLPWVITAYLGTSAVAVVVAGPVVDAVGVRRTFQVTGVWFLATSAAAAIAPNLPLLVAARALQGFAGGLIISVALAAVGLAYPHRLRSRAFAANSLVWGAMGFGGPALAAGLLAVGDWRLLFAINLPLGAVALAMGWRTLPTIDGPRQRIVVDWVGIAMLSALTATSLAAVAQVGVNWVVVGVATSATAVAALAYWRHSGRVAHPVLERNHLTRFPMRRIHVTSGLVLIAGLAANNYLPLYIQVARGRSEAFAAFSVVFLTVGWTVASVISAKLMDRRPESDVIVLGGFVIVPAVALGGATIAFDLPLATVFAAFFVVGMGVGFVSTAGLTLLQGSNEATEIGRANAAHQFIRTLCITYAVAAGGAILLLVVDYQVGDVEVVRDVLAGEDVALGPATAAAVGDGVAWVTVLSFAAGLGCLWVAGSLARRTRALRPQLAS